MIIGDGKWLTDAQWLSLMKLADDRPMRLEMPTAPTTSARLEIDGERMLVRPDGSVEKQ